jgi:hypothetical protein
MILESGVISPPPKALLGTSSHVGWPGLLLQHILCQTPYLEAVFFKMSLTTRHILTKIDSVTLVYVFADVQLFANDHT